MKSQKDVSTEKQTASKQSMDKLGTKNSNVVDESKINKKRADSADYPNQDDFYRKPAAPGVDQVTEKSDLRNKKFTGDRGQNFRSDIDEDQPTSYRKSDKH